MQATFPLWRRDTHSLAHEMIASGIVAHLICVDLGQLDPSYAGRPFDSAFLSHLPYDIDPCGETARSIRWIPPDLCSLRQSPCMSEKPSSAMGSSMPMSFLIEPRSPSLRSRKSRRRHALPKGVRLRTYPFRHGCPAP